MSLQIRVAREEDSARLAALCEHAHSPHVAARPDIFKPTLIAELEAWYRTLLLAPATRAWLAERDGEPVGYVLSILRVSEENPVCVARRWLELDQIAVAPAHRGQGIGRALAEEVLAHARAQGLRSVELNTWSFNRRAHAVFAKLGFTPQRLRFERQFG